MHGRIGNNDNEVGPTHKIEKFYMWPGDAKLPVLKGNFFDFMSKA